MFPGSSQRAGPRMSVSRSPVPNSSARGFAGGSPMVPPLPQPRSAAASNRPEEWGREGRVTRGLLADPYHRRGGGDRLRGEAGAREAGLDAALDLVLLRVD